MMTKLKLLTPTNKADKDAMWRAATEAIKYRVPVEVDPNALLALMQEIYDLKVIAADLKADLVLREEEIEHIRDHPEYAM